MKDKFTIELVWHNCKTYPPKEDKNNNLFISNGEFVHKVFYNIEFGWCDCNLGILIPEERLSEFWWADLEQTVREEKEFKV